MECSADKIEFQNGEVHHYNLISAAKFMMNGEVRVHACVLACTTVFLYNALAMERKVSSLNGTLVSDASGNREVGSNAGSLSSRSLLSAAEAPLNFIGRQVRAESVVACVVLEEEDQSSHGTSHQCPAID